MTSFANAHFCFEKMSWIPNNFYLKGSFIGSPFIISCHKVCNNLIFDISICYHTSVRLDSWNCFSLLDGRKSKKLINCDTLVLVVCRVGQSQNSWVRRKVVPSQSSLSLSHDSFSNDSLIASSGPLLFQLDNLTKYKVIIKQSLEIGERHVSKLNWKWFI